MQDRTKLLDSDEALPIPPNCPPLQGPGLIIVKDGTLRIDNYQKSLESSYLNSHKVNLKDLPVKSQPSRAAKGKAPVLDETPQEVFDISDDEPQKKVRFFL